MLQSLQEVFNHVVIGLSNQNKLSFTTEDVGGHTIFPGMVRDKKGNKCALGFCISDESYQKHWEEYKNSLESVNAEDVFGLELMNAFDIIHESIRKDQDTWDLLEALQSAHDLECQMVGEGRDPDIGMSSLMGRFRVIARDWDLEFPRVYS